MIAASNNRFDANGLNSIIGAGAVFAYDSNGSSWTLSQRIVASDRVVNYAFGADIDINGTTNLVVGSTGNSTDGAGASSLASAGAAYHFIYNGSSWTQAEKFVPSNAVKPNSRVATDLFGSPVSVSGTNIMIGAGFQDFDSNGSNSVNAGGAVYYFSNSTFITSQTSYLNSRVVRLF